MQLKTTLALFLALAVTSASAQSASIYLYPSRSCAGASNWSWRNVGCNSCYSPGNNQAWLAAEVTGISPTQRWTLYAGNTCGGAPAAQRSGPGCLISNPIFRSVFLGCPRQALSAVNGTEVGEVKDAQTANGDAGDV